EYRSKLSSDLDECVYVKKIESLIENMQNLRPGTEAKDFNTKDIDGKAVSLSALRGKKVILHFWASWCSDCRQELSAMRYIYKNSDKNKLKIIGISINSNIPELRDFISKNEIEWQQVCDEKEWMSPIAQQYAVRAVPTLVVIDEKGKIVTSGNSVSEIEKALK
ncbi:MAG: TlpA family protein disulfide reductase, partial [Bacteroidaceae bacterium]|nr:TlpA family protein disulfide reductase [Bacteroidaceae bacterium]